MKPPRAGLAPGDASIELEVWELPSSSFGSFVKLIAAPLGIGWVRLLIARGRAMTHGRFKRVGWEYIYINRGKGSGSLKGNHYSSMAVHGGPGTLIIDSGLQSDRICRRN